MFDINKAFDSLLNNAIEKAKKGEKKVGNPAYRKTLNQKGNVIYVLVDKTEHPKAQLSLTKEEFVEARAFGDVEQHFDESPIVRSISDMEHLGFLKSSTIDLVERCLSRVKFYEKSIAFAKAIGNEKAVEGHQKGIDRELGMIDKKVENDFKKATTVDYLNDDVVSQLRAAGVSVNNGHPISAEAVDFVNSNFAKFDFPKLVSGMKDAIESQKKSLEKMGIPTSGWKPEIIMSFSNNGFTIGMSNNTGDVEDNAKFKTHLNVNMNRSFSVVNGKSHVYHSIFVLGQKTTDTSSQNPLRGGFAKKIMSNFYEQYDHAGIKTIGVSAAGNFGEPYCGANTWGRWGFEVDKGAWNSMLDSYKSRVGESKMFFVDEKVMEHKNRDEIYEWKKNENKSYSKIEYKNGDSTNLVGRKTKTEIKTKATSEDTFRSKIRTHVEIKKADVEKVEKIMKEWMDKNPEAKKVPLVLLFEKMDNAVLRGIMAATGFSGTVDLEDPIQKEAFNRNVNKKYERIPAEKIKELEAEHQSEAKSMAEGDEWHVKSRR